MSLILSIETATEVCSIALYNKNHVTIEFNLNVEKAHSKYLAKLVDEAWSMSEFDRKELNAVAVSEGPGSYTGLRIGTSLAKGLCYGLEIPLIAVNTLEAMALQVRKIDSGSILCPMIDARRMEIYYLLKDENFQTIQKTSNMIVDENSFGEILKKKKVCFFGNGSSKCRSVLGNHPNAIFVDDILATAKPVAEIAYKKYIDQDFADLAYFEPFYFKEFKAGKPKKLV